MVSLVRIGRSDKAKSDRSITENGVQSQKSQKQSQNRSGSQIQRWWEEYTKSDKNYPLSFFSLLPLLGDSMGFCLTRLNPVSASRPCRSAEVVSLAEMRRASEAVCAVRTQDAL